MKEATEHLKHSVCEADIHGGSGPASEAMYNAFRNKDYGKLDALFQAWAQSLVLSDDKNKNTTSVIGFDVVPIWVLVDEYNPARASLRKYVLQQLEAVGNKQLINAFDNYPY